MGPDLDPTWLWVLKTVPLYVLIPFGLMIIAFLVEIGINIWEMLRSEEPSDPRWCDCRSGHRCDGPPQYFPAPLPKRMRTVAGRHHPRRKP